MNESIGVVFSDSLHDNSHDGGNFNFAYAQPRSLADISEGFDGEVKE